MRIGVEATSWQNSRGVGRYVRMLLCTLVRLDEQNRYTFFIDRAEGSETLPAGAEIRLVRTSVPSILAASPTSHRSTQDLWRMSRALSQPEFDILFFPSTATFVPVLSRAKKVVMIFGVLLETYPKLTLPGLTERLLRRVIVALGCRQADAIVTISEYSRQGILKWHKVSPERLFVLDGAAHDPIFRVLNDPHPTPRLDSLGISEGRTIVYVGAFDPHKNLEALVGAFARLATQREFSDLCLVMVGEYQKQAAPSVFESLRRRVQTLGIPGRVIFTGYLPDEELVVLLNRSSLLVLPSLMESYGQTAVEAAACGCPVIATSASPLPRILGGGGVYIDPAKPEELERALIHVLQSESVRRQMREAGLAAVRRLSWDRAAGRLMSVMQNLVAQ